jgi:hypothetical protein
VYFFIKKVGFDLETRDRLVRSKDREKQLKKATRRGGAAYSREWRAKKAVVRGKNCCHAFFENYFITEKFY